MFGHLKAKDFAKLTEGIDHLPAKRRSHLEACARCRAAWMSLESLHTEVSSIDDEVPEPDWEEFRSSVRDQMLSRSIQRETAVRRWTGWAIRPAAWALSVFMAVGVTTVAFLWNTEHRTPAPAVRLETPTPEPPAEVIEAGPERTLFDDLVQLGDKEQEQLRQMLESAQKGPRQRE